MQLLPVLVIIVSLLTVLSGIALVLGSSKSEKGQGVWFLISAISEVIWGVSIAVFLTLGRTEFDYDIAPLFIKGIYVGAILMDASILGYVSWKYKFGKVLTIIFLSIGAMISAVFLYDPKILYSSIILSNDGNRIIIDTSSWFFYAYIIYFCTLVPAFCLSLIYRIKHTINKNAKKGYTIFLVGLAIAGFLSLIFDLILPLSNYSLIWVGPLAIGLVILGFYYAILRFKMISLSYQWLKALSSIIIILSMSILYLLIFFLVFTSLFRGTTPSWTVILLNFVMIAILLLLMPAILELFAFIRSLMSPKKIDVPYISKKLDGISRNNYNLKELSAFLADHLHLSYVGFVLSGRVVGSSNIGINSNIINSIQKLEKPKSGIFQVPDRATLKTLEANGIEKVGVLLNKDGKVFGQFVLGSFNRKILERRDLIEIEMIINLAALVIENGCSKS